MSNEKMEARINELVYEYCAEYVNTGIKQDKNIHDFVTDIIIKEFVFDIVKITIDDVLKLAKARGEK